MNPWLHPSRSRKNGNVLDPETENVGPDLNLAALHTGEGIVQDHDQNPKVQEENTGRDQKVLIERKIRKNQVDIIRKSIKIIDIEVHPVIVVTVMLKNINQTEKN